MEDIKEAPTANSENYTVHLMVLLNRKFQRISIVDKIKINSDKIKTVKSLKYYIIDKYKNKNFCPCKLTISIPFEDSYYCSEINDMPEKDLNECIFEGNIYIIIDLEKKCDCGFQFLESLSKRDIYEIYTKKIKKLTQIIESQKSENNQKIKDLEELNKDILISYDKEINQKIETNQNTINCEDSNINKEKGYIFNLVFEDFYDIIIDIKSIKDINEGWKIKMNKKEN